MATAIGSDIAESGLVLAIDFANPKSYPGSGTTVFDLSGNNYNGTLTNGPTFSSEYGGACVLDGTNDSINFNAQILSGTGDFTVSMWFRRTAGSGTVFGNYPAGNLQVFFGPLYLGMWLNSSNLYSDATSNFTPNPVNMVVQRSGTTTYLYVNNTLRMTASSSANIGTTSDFRIGTNTSGSEVFGGYYYSCTVYNRFLSTAEIAQNYNAEIRRFLPTIPVIDNSLVLNLDAGNRLSFLNYGGSKSYWCGGSYSNTNVTDKLTYSNDTTAAQTSANLTLARGYPVGNSDGATKGYVSGDISPTAATDKLTFSSDTTAAQTTANLSSARGACGGASNYSTKAFAVGGYGSPSLITADRIIFSTDTTSAATTANLSTGKSQTTSNLTDMGTKGYFAGGGTSGDIVTALTDKIIFSIDMTMAMSTANISTAKRNPAGLSAVSGRGYLGGGYSNTATNNFEKITFVNDTTSSVSTATLSQSRWGPNGGSEASSKGFICGGYVSGGVATADKILFASETCSAQTSANLSVGRYLPACLEEIYNTSSTTWVDLSTNYYNMSLINGVSYGLTEGGFLSFDGSNDYAETNAINLILSRKTLAAWCQLNNTSQTGGGLVGVMTNDGLTFDTIVYNETGQGWGFGSNYFLRTAWSGVAETSTTTWVHIAATYDNNNYRLYRNGSLILTTTSYSVFTFTTSIKFIAGKRHATITGPLNAKIAEATIYSRALSATEILQNFNADRQRFGV